ncbi:MAG TPA: glycosyltransferase family 2 protein [Salinivirgaceae bacterium]|nr:glycosyltransferase family 2 protein [Salinivirgaceae bacterium]HQA75512.1 glycosyltransferase family 2 protein [Salinivirgaceae bacterium]
MLQKIVYFIKDMLKDIAHNLPIVPYRKPSKRYRIWNKTKEKRFLSLINKKYTENSEKIDAITVSVIMPTYNRNYCIAKAIDSIINQTHKNWELLVINDGSTDNIEAIEQKYKPDNRIIFFHKTREGISRSRNFGIEQSKGKYIFYLDTDNQWFENYLQTMITYMETNNLDICYSAIQLFDDSEKIIGYYGEPFNYEECRELNHIDINGLGHINIKDNKEIRFDETLKRLVDWDFVLTIAKNRNIKYAPFLGVNYYDGQKGDRITFTVSTGDQIMEIINIIQKKHGKIN